MEQPELEYVGFWARVGASLIDTILLGFIIVPAIEAVYGTGYWLDPKLIKGPLDVLISWVFPAIAVISFWVTRQASPGKMAISARVVDARTGGKPSIGQFIGRYLGYFISIIPLCLGLVWVAFDRRKQGWHDKLAGTVVVRPRGPEPVRFDGSCRRTEEDDPAALPRRLSVRHK